MIRRPSRRRGQALTEYVVVVGLVALLLVGAVALLRGALEAAYGAAGRRIEVEVTGRLAAEPTSAAAGVAAAERSVFEPTPAPGVFDLLTDEDAPEGDGPGAVAGPTFEGPR